jgi:hypothetical protein
LGFSEPLIDRNTKSNETTASNVIMSVYYSNGWDYLCTLIFELLFCFPQISIFNYKARLLIWVTEYLSTYLLIFHAAFCSVSSDTAVAICVTATRDLAGPPRWPRPQTKLSVPNEHHHFFLFLNVPHHRPVFVGAMSNTAQLHHPPMSFLPYSFSSFAITTTNINIDINIDIDTDGG